MAYKANNSRGKGRSSSGRKPSGDGEKRSWNQRTTHEESAEPRKPARRDTTDEKSEPVREKSSFRKDDDRKTYRGGDERKPRSFNRERDGDDSKSRKPFAKSWGDGERPAKRSYSDDVREERKPRSYAKDDGDKTTRKPYARPSGDGDERPAKRSYNDDVREERKPRSYAKDDGDKTTRKPYTRPSGEGDERPARRSYKDDVREERAPRAKKDDDFTGERRERKFSDDRPGEKRERKPYVKREDSREDTGERKSYGDRDSRSSDDRKPRSDRFERRERKPDAERPERSFEDRHPRNAGGRFEKRERPSGSEEEGNEGEEKRPYERTERKPFDRKKYEGAGSKGEYRGRDSKRTFDKRSGGSSYKRKPLRRSNFSEQPKGTNPDTKTIAYPDGTVKEERLTRLNKYLANSGICSRREADELIKAGLVTVNGEIVTEMGIKIARTDIVKYNNTAIRKERKVYVLLNKPKDYITTTDDPAERKTVMSLVENAGKERIYPVGRLDRNTTGLLLITNDGELTKKLTHPASNIKKIYHVELDKNLVAADLKKIAAGIELEDGFIKVDEINYDGDGKDKSQIGIAIHSGKNRIVRRIFETLNYEVRKLDRVIFAGLTKKDLPRGKWRNLSEIEVNMLKMIAGTR